MDRAGQMPDASFEAKLREDMTDVKRRDVLVETLNGRVAALPDDLQEQFSSYPQMVREGRMTAARVEADLHEAEEQAKRRESLVEMLNGRVADLPDDLQERFSSYPRMVRGGRMTAARVEADLHEAWEEVKRRESLVEMLNRRVADLPDDLQERFSSYPRMVRGGRMTAARVEEDLHEAEEKAKSRWWW